ncbi:MAG: single-stranded DNA-binding protein [Chloroflexi bacterium]|nr:single-stranded DNA-binding protein [Chloroflexota bacterium]
MNKGLNKVMIIGWVEGEPEVRQTPNGRQVASFSVGTSRTWTSSDGDKHEETEWFNVVAWGNLAEICSKRLGDRQQVYVEGRLQTRSWDDNSGRKHFRTEVVAHELIALADNDI